MYRYAPQSEQPKLGRTLSELSAAERVICERMSDADFLQKLLELLALEEEKGRDRFHPDNFAFFKVPFSTSNEMYNALYSSVLTLIRSCLGTLPQLRHGLLGAGARALGVDGS